MQLQVAKERVGGNSIHMGVQLSGEMDVELSKMWTVGMCVNDRNGKCAAGGNILPGEK